jgi:phosphohistidine phosphatase
MKTLVLVRHAKSSWDDPGLSDHERPLSKRGQRDAPLMGARLAEWGPAVDRVISSSAARALETAELMIQEMGFPWDEIQISEELYHASEDDMMDLIREQDDDIDGLMIFGHNPGMTYLVNDLCDLDLDNLPTCGVVVLQFGVDSWFEVPEAEPVAVELDFPRNR